MERAYNSVQVDQLNRSRFEEFSIDHQVTIINECLKSGSLNEIAQQLGYKYESSIRKRFKKAGYERRGKKFVLVGVAAAEPVEIIKPIVEPAVEPQEEPTTNKPQIHHSHKLTTGQRLDKVEQELQQLKELLQTQHSYTTTTTFKLYRSNGKAVSRSYRVYPEVLEKLEQVKSKYPEYSLQDVFNSLLMEALEKYTD